MAGPSGYYGAAPNLEYEVLLLACPTESSSALRNNGSVLVDRGVSLDIDIDV
jgi:hypothetical protein